MRRASFRHPSLIAVISLIAVMGAEAGCTQERTAAMPPPVDAPASNVAPLASDAVKTKGVLYAAGPNANIVGAYRPYADDPPPLREITNGLFAPTGIGVDAAGNVYVCNNAGQGLHRQGKGTWTVTVYHRHGTVPFRTYTNGVWSPVDVAVAPDGTVYVANFSSHVVSVYPPGSVDPSRTLVAPANTSPLGIAVDGSGRVYVTYVVQYGGNGSVYAYAPGHDRGKDLGIAFSGEPHGIAVDNTGNLIVAVSQAPSPGSDVEIFPPGATQPSQRLFGPFQPFMLTLNTDNTRLYVADYGSGNNDGGVFVYAYPRGAELYKDMQGPAAGAYGVAFDAK